MLQNTFQNNVSSENDYGNEQQQDDQEQQQKNSRVSRSSDSREKTQ